MQYSLYIVYTLYKAYWKFKYVVLDETSDLVP